jgi:NAD(P)-dependent dehydrogenase (short-subunit alcohol dehydrogenase family)
MTRESTAEFADRVVFVTGAASGIGAATAAAFAAEGARVAILDIDAEGAAAAARRIAADVGAERVVALAADIRDDAATAGAVDDVVDRWGGIDHLVNSAVNFVAVGPAATREQWEAAFGVNVIGPALLTATVADHMGPGSTIVNVSSISAHAAQPDRWTYNATKAAILALTRGQALDLRGRGIRVNSVSPGWIWTPEVAKAAKGDRARWEPLWGQYHILERLGEASEVADAILYLSSERSSFVTGTELFVDGGYNALGPEGLGTTARFAGTSDR